MILRPTMWPFHLWKLSFFHQPWCRCRILSCTLNESLTPWWPLVHQNNYEILCPDSEHPGDSDNVKQGAKKRKHSMPKWSVLHWCLHWYSKLFIATQYRIWKVLLLILLKLWEIGLTSLYCILDTKKYIKDLFI